MSPPPDPISKNLFGDPDYLSYLDQLTATSLESLKLEPAKLRREASQLQTQLADLAFREYRTFLHANDCTRAMHETFDGLLTRLDALTAQIPDLASSCQSFAASSAIDVLKQRRREHLLLNQHSKMVELLEIPQLMDTLIRNGYYEEAMDLHAHVRRLLLRYPRIELLKSVADELEAATKLMLTQLVNLFTGDVKLPVCIRVIGYLRRMEAVPEPELRLIFLQQRDKYFKRRLEETCGKTPSPNALSKDHVDHLKKYIDVWTNRECFFDIVAQYRGIFSDSQSTTNPSSSALPKSASTFVYDSETHQSLTQSILSSYVTFRVQHLCAMLQAHLPYITDATQIASLCSQVMYFGQSLGWVGIDFRVVVSSLFEDAIEGIVRKTTSQGVREFVGWIREQTVLPMGSDLGSTIKNPGTGSANSQLRVIPAPTGLLAHPPLAHLLNAYFTAYNHLRALPALTLRARSTSFFHGQLRACAEALDSAMSSEWDNWNSDQKETGRIIVKAWCQGLVP
ncbi:Dor1-like family-domain-containing protein, partial [Phlyctochytrium arcticum]